MKKIKGFCFILLLITLSFAFFMCQPNDQDSQKLYFEKEDVFIWNLNMMPRIFYPSMTLNESEKALVNHLYEGLTRVVDGQVKMGMAKDYTVDKSRLVYTFTIKKVRWSNGRLVQAKDFIYAWERSDHYLGPVNLLYLNAFIDEVWVDEDDKLVIRLKRQNDDLLKDLSHVAFMPVSEDALDLNNPLSVESGSVVNGPFYLSSNNPEYGLILKKNRNYHEAVNVDINEIHAIYDKSFARVYRNINLNKVHFAENVDWYNLDYYVAYEPKVKIYKDPSKYVFAFNTSHAILEKLELRQLMKKTVDIEAINPFFNISSRSQNKSSFLAVRDYQGDPFLASIESEDLENLYGLRIVTRDNENAIRVGSLLAENWRAFLGIECVVEPKNDIEYYDALKNRDYDVVLTKLTYNPTNLWAFLKKFWGNQPLNIFNYYKDEYDQLMYEAYLKQDQLYLMEAQKMLEESSIFFTVFPSYDAVFIQDTVKNWSRSHEGLFYFGQSSILKAIDLK